MARYRGAKSESSETAACLDAVLILKLAPKEEVDAILDLLRRHCAMMTGLMKVRR